MKRSWSTKRVIYLLVVGLLATACGSDAGTGEPAQERLDASPASPDGAATGSPGEGETAAASCDGESLKVAQARPSLFYAPFVLADEAGFFEDAGLDIELIDLGSGADVTAAMVGGSIDVALSTFTSMLFSRNAGAPVKAIAPLSEQVSLGVVVKTDVLEEAGITDSSSPEEKGRVLEGLEIAVSSVGGGTDQAIRFIMEEVGLDPESDATIVATGGTGIVPAFIQGDVQAFAAGLDNVPVGAGEGEGTILFNLGAGEFPAMRDILFSSVFTAESTIEDRPDAVRCLLVGIDRAIQMLNSDPEGAREILRPVFVQEDGTGNEFYDAAFDLNLPAAPDDVVIEVESAQRALEFANVFAEPQITIDAADAVETDLASEAAAAVSDDA